MFAVRNVALAVLLCCIVSSAAMARSPAFGSKMIQQKKLQQVADVINVSRNKAIEAVRSCDRLTLSRLIDDGELNPNEPIVSGMPLLGFATRMLSTREWQLQAAIENGLGQQTLKEIEEKVDDSTDLLHWLANHPRVHLDATDELGRTFIGMAARESSFYALKIALDRGLSANEVDGRGNTPLLIHLIFGSNTYDVWVEKLKFLVEKAKANVNVSNDNGTTPLHMIVAFESTWGGTELTEYILNHGANPNTDSLGGYPLDLAYSGGNHGLVDLLIQHGASKVRTYPNVALHPDVVWER